MVDQKRVEREYAATAVIDKNMAAYWGRRYALRWPIVPSGEYT
jgi:hypothetical protein